MLDAEFNDVFNAIALARWSLVSSAVLLILGARLAFLHNDKRGVGVRALSLVALIAAPLVAAASIPALRNAISGAGNAGMMEYGSNDEAVSRRLHDRNEQLLRRAAADVNESSLQVFMGTRLSIALDSAGLMSRRPKPSTWIRAVVVLAAAVLAGVAVVRNLPASTSSLMVGGVSAVLMISMAASWGWQSVEISRVASASNMLDAFDEFDRGRSR